MHSAPSSAASPALLHGGLAAEADLLGLAAAASTQAYREGRRSYNSWLGQNSNSPIYFITVYYRICFEICTPEGRGREKGGSANFKMKHTEPLTQEIPSALY